MQEINSKDNPKIKLYRKLSDDRKCRAEHGLFVLEGVRLVDEAESAGWADSIFITKSFLENYGRSFTDVHDDISVYVIADELSKKLSDTENPQGIFAICKTPEYCCEIRHNGRYILLHHIQDPGNLGTIIRTADAFGIDGIITVDCCDIFNPKVIRSTMGGIFRVNVLNLSIDKAFAALREKSIATYAAVADKNASSFEVLSFSGGCAVLIGNEGNGLPEDITARCTQKFTIKTRISLNASVAAGIIMYKLGS
ncbi:MAG: RNA methyltransferase [Oscillospiraceae bacterium]|nr:RNA methyltransferase [Oscillospiraceae bacterium]